MLWLTISQKGYLFQGKWWLRSVSFEHFDHLQTDKPPHSDSGEHKSVEGGSPLLSSRRHLCLLNSRSLLTHGEISSSSGRFFLKTSVPCCNKTCKSRNELLYANNFLQKGAEGGCSAKSHSLMVWKWGWCTPPARLIGGGREGVHKRWRGPVVLRSSCGSAKYAAQATLTQRGSFICCNLWKFKVLSWLKIMGKSRKDRK